MDLCEKDDEKENDEENGESEAFMEDDTSDGATISSGDPEDDEINCGRGCGTRKVVAPPRSANRKG